MDIDDILASVDAQAIPQETRDLHDLTRAWVAERAAPEILPWPESLMDRTMERIQRQVSNKPAYRFSSAIAVSTLVLRVSTARTNQQSSKGGVPIDRARGDADGEHGSQGEFRPHRAPDGTRAVQIPRAVALAGEDG